MEVSFLGRKSSGPDRGFQASGDGLELESDLRRKGVHGGQKNGAFEFKRLGVDVKGLLGFHRICFLPWK
jgi:hypothetical protein